MPKQKSPERKNVFTVSDAERRIIELGDEPLTLDDGKTAEAWIEESKAMDSATGIETTTHSDQLELN